MLIRPNIQYEGARHVPQLDAIRGYAILLVLVYHFFAEEFPPFNIGWVGVDMFFVLSGFLITGILLDSKTSQGYFKNFYIKRVLRIFPLYFFVLAVILYLVPAFFPNAIPDLDYYMRNQLWFWTYFQNWVFTIDGYPNDRVLRYTWSLCIEEQFYLFWPFLVYKLNRKTLLGVVLGFILMANFLRAVEPHFINNNYKYVNTFARIDALSVGALVAILIRTHRQILEKWATPVSLISGLAIIGIIAVKKTLYFGELYASFSFFALLFGGILVWSLSSNLAPVFRRAVSIRPMLFLGKYSYGLYLYHVPIHHWSAEVLADHEISHATEPLKFFLIKLILLAVTIIVSVLSFKYLETPFLKLKKVWATAPATEYARNR